MVPIGPACKLCGREPVETGVRPTAIVIVVPLGDHFACMRQRAECGLIQALVAKSPIERLHERVLDRLARLDVVSVNATLLLPAKERCRGQLRAIVADHEQRLAAPGDDGVEFAGDAAARE